MSKTNDTVERLIERLIDERRADLDQVEKRAERLRLEIQALEQTFITVSGTAGRAPPPPAPRRPQPARAAAPVRRTQPRRSWVSNTWKNVLGFIGRQGTAGVSTDDILAHCERENLGVLRTTLRSQLSVYAERGILERLQPGMFRLTARGAGTVDSTGTSASGSEATGA